MALETVEAHWIEARVDYTARELAELSGLSPALVDDLVASGALPDAGAFDAASVVLVRRARRLRDDFDLDAPALALAVALLRRMQALEGELAALRRAG